MTELDTIWAEFDAFRKVHEVVPEPIKKVSHYDCKCGGTKLYSPEGLPVCTSCGVVEKGFIDDNPEWVSSVGEDGSVSDQGRVWYAFGHRSIFRSMGCWNGYQSQVGQLRSSKDGSDKLSLIYESQGSFSFPRLQRHRQSGQK